MAAFMKRDRIRNVLEAFFMKSFLFNGNVFLTQFTSKKLIFSLLPPNKHAAQDRVLRSFKNTNLNYAHSRTLYGEKSTERFGAKLFSKLPKEIKESRHQYAFKWTLKCHLRKETFIKTCFDNSFFNLNLQF